MVVMVSIFVLDSAVIWNQLCLLLAQDSASSAQQLHFYFFSLLLAWPALARCGPFLLENAGSGQ